VKARSLVVIACIAAVAAALYAAFGPTYVSCTGEAVQAGCRHGSTVAVNGWWVLVVVAIPVVVALVPLIFDRATTRTVSTVLLWTFSMITGFSVGLFFVPAAVVMTIASVRSGSVPTATT
jgi:hypothetical protein